MPALHLLGTGSAVTDAHRTTTMLALEDEGHALLIDCGGDAFQRARMAGIDPDCIDGLIITHEHPDHVAGFPLLILRIWQTGRSRPIPVYGPPSALAQAQRLLNAFHTDGWDLPEIQWITVDPDSPDPFIATAQFEISAGPGCHSVPVIGLRCVHRPSGFVVGYSCDTEPCDSMQNLLDGSDLIVHEATGAVRGHTSA
ncbi:MAG: MBL fold metallo-hydrolase, partial [Rhodothermales bacterium]|nr:MBL fold metallo-hydrolase [Rhodothermales bacterium]